MPKLSSYLGPRSAQYPSKLEKPDVLASGARLERDGGPSVSRGRSAPGSRGNTEHNRLIEIMEKRRKDFGERQYRWSDGSLRSTRPPRNPYAVSSRRSWRSLVEYCRMQGGDTEYQKTGASQRYAIKVPFRMHEEYLASIGLESEMDEEKEFKGHDENRDKPLEDSSHAFNTYYKEESESILAQGSGTIL